MTRDALPRPPHRPVVMPLIVKVTPLPIMKSVRDFGLR